ncbi:hypothetical protein RBB50_011467 [Rhinocladiella similis]
MQTSQVCNRGVHSLQSQNRLCRGLHLPASRRYEQSLVLFLIIIPSRPNFIVVSTFFCFDSKRVVTSCIACANCHWSQRATNYSLNNRLNSTTSARTRAKKVRKNKGTKRKRGNDSDGEEGLRSSSPATA